MTTGAIILAAGMAETFGPIQTTGTITVAQRIVATLQKAGITRILVITGYQAEDLEHHLTKNNIVFIRNVNYTNSEMIDSARMGLSFLSDKCDKIVLCPCDIPFFTACTVQTLLNTEGDYIRPVWQGQTGHPIVCSQKAAHAILAYQGAGGIREALQANGIPSSPIPVRDPGIVTKVNEALDDQDLIQKHSRTLIRPVIKVAYTKEKIFFDARIALLLGLIHEFRSVAKACQAMQISYTAGWNMIRQIEAQADCPLVLRNVGGAKGSHSELTKEGRQLLDSFTRFESELSKDADALFIKHLPDFLKQE